MRRIEALLLDVEGTTTPVDFVHATLFGFARARLEAFLSAHWDEEATQADVRGLAAEHANDAAVAPRWHHTSGAVAAYAAWLMDQDRKSTPLKSLQGRIWEDGYRAGTLRGAVYADVPRAFERWTRIGRRIAIFSSGSILAQRLLFAHSIAGDLSGFIEAFFDTTTGPKRDAASYGRIAAALRLAPEAVLFLSDVVAELDPARSAGMDTGLSLRDGAAAPPASSHQAVTSFDEVDASLLRE